MTLRIDKNTLDVASSFKKGTPHGSLKKNAFHAYCLGECYVCGTWHGFDQKGDIPIQP
jgi:hypothetical protein